MQCNGLKYGHNLKKHFLRYSSQKINNHPLFKQHESTMQSLGLPRLGLPEGMILPRWLLVPVATALIIMFTTFCFSVQPFAPGAAETATSILDHVAVQFTSLAFYIYKEWIIDFKNTLPEEIHSSFTQAVAWSFTFLVVFLPVFVIMSLRRTYENFYSFFNTIIYYCFLIFFQYLRRYVCALTTWRIIFLFYHFFLGICIIDILLSPSVNPVKFISGWRT